MPATSEIRALVSLLSDEDPKITNLVWEQLASLGAEALPSLREACESADARLRIRARHALSLLSLDQIERDLQSMTAADDAALDLEGIFWALARVESPELRREEISWPLDDIAARVRPRLAGAQTPLERVRAFNLVFHGQMKFSGVAPDWDDPAATSLHRVLETRRGSPVLLGVVYLLVGRRLGLPFVGIGLPNHFLVKYESGSEEIFVDPFYGGRTFDRRECVVAYLRDYHAKEEYIQEVEGREIAVRALRGMILCYSKHQDKLRVRRLARYLEILQVRERAR